MLDPRVVSKRPLEIVLYGLGACSDDPPQTQERLLAWLRELGFRTPAFTRLCGTADEVLRAIDDLDAVRDSFGFETDGAVIKLNSLEQRERAGFTSRAPRWAKAWKFVAEQAETQLRDITVQVGRTGVLTPVAELDPTLLRGSTISRATLHNEDEIRRKDIRIGDTVIIEKAGEVIPAVVRVVLEKRDPAAQPFEFEKHLGGKCPACGGAIARALEFAVWLCTNLSCPAQKTRRLEYFARRGALDIEGLGGIVADRLVETGMVAEPLDVFDLQLDALAALNLGSADEPRVFGRKNASKMVETISRARTLPLARWLHALAIPKSVRRPHTIWRARMRRLHPWRSRRCCEGREQLDQLNNEIAAANPRARQNRDISDLEKQQLTTRHAELQAQIAPIQQRLEQSGFAQADEEEGRGRRVDS
jgi:DNA ligase (NAD+)